MILERLGELTIDYSARRYLEHYEITGQNPCLSVSLASIYESVFNRFIPLLLAVT